MKIEFATTAIEPMVNWLLMAKQGNRDEHKLREILTMDDYQIEFARYGMKNLPVCNITYEEAVDFFMNFDRKTFTNQRLEYKKPFFLVFYKNIEERLQRLNIFNKITSDDLSLIERLLKNSLPSKVFHKIDKFKIIFIISIGNSMGWPYENNLDFDVSNFDVFKDKETFLHVIAHEIHHILFEDLINEVMTPQEAFLVNFAFEGLAVHFHNNASTFLKPSKYENTESNLAIEKEDWAFYEDEFDELFAMFKRDVQKCLSLDMDEVSELLSEKYENFDHTSLKTGTKKKISQYPTYYLGCYLWGLIDQVFGEDVLYELLKKPAGFIETYNKAVDKTNKKYYL